MRSRLFTALGLFTLILFLTSAAQAKDLANRLGVGIKNNNSFDVPAVAAVYYPNADVGLTGSLGVDTAEDNSLTFNSEEAAEAAGEARLCGISSWQGDQEKSILGTSCLANMPSSADAEFPQILNYSSGNLSFGVMSGNGSTRPTQLSGAPFTRNASADVEDDDETPDLGDVADELER